LDHVKPSESQRARGKPGARCARSLECKNKKAHEYSHHGHIGIARHSPRNGFTIYIELFPAIGLVVTVISRMKFCQLDASVEASEPHDFAVRFRAVRPQHICVHRIPHHVP
jgi:hypothetical protein